MNIKHFAGVVMISAALVLVLMFFFAQNNTKTVVTVDIKQVMSDVTRYVALNEYGPEDAERIMTAFATTLEESLMGMGEKYVVISSGAAISGADDKTDELRKRISDKFLGK